MAACARRGFRRGQRQQRLVLVAGGGGVGAASAASSRWAPAYRRAASRAGAAATRTPCARGCGLGRVMGVRGRGGREREVGAGSEGQGSGGARKAGGVRSGARMRTAWLMGERGGRLRARPERAGATAQDALHGALAGASSAGAARLQAARRVSGRWLCTGRLRMSARLRKASG